MKTWIPNDNPVRLALCDPNQVVYYPVSREHWVLMCWRWTTPTDNGTRIQCEVIAESKHSGRLGRLLSFTPETQVYLVNEMEILALSTL